MSKKIEKLEVRWTQVGMIFLLFCLGSRNRIFQEWPWSRKLENGRQNWKTCGNINRKWILIWFFSSGWSKCKSTSALIVRRIPSNGKHCRRSAAHTAIARFGAIQCGMQIQKWNCFHHHRENSRTGHRFYFDSRNKWMFIARLFLRCHQLQTFHETNCGKPEFN